jgi:hypothetical protein
LSNIDHSPVGESNEAAGLAFLVRMRPNAGRGLLSPASLLKCAVAEYRGARHLSATCTYRQGRTRPSKPL